MMSFFSRGPVLSIALGLTAIAAVTTSVFYPWNDETPMEAQIAPFMNAFALRSASA